jgi:hypothetical protein
MVSQLLSISNSVFTAIVQQYRTAHQIPTIRILSDPTPSAQGMDGRVEVSTGLIDHCLSFAFPYVTEVAQDAQALANVDHTFLPAAMFSWVLAHEFFHVVRAHNDVVEALGNEEFTSHALEHDADLCALAALFRQLQHRHRSTLSDVDIRRLTFYSLFWPLRTLTIPRQATHPSIAERLWHILSKLSILPEFDGEPADVSFSQQKSKQNSLALWLLLRSCEKHYCQSAEAPPLIAEILELLDSGRIVSVAKRWDEMRGQVAAISGTRA